MFMATVTNERVVIRWRKLCLAYLILEYFSILMGVDADIFTAIVNIKPLLITDSELPKVVKIYLEMQENEIKKQPLIKRLAQKFLKPKFENVKDSEAFLHHPVNIFLLIKHLTVDWNDLKSKMNKKVIEGLLNKHIVKKRRLKFPTSLDLNGAAVALKRLQDIYNLSTTTIASGEIIPGVLAFKNLSAVECYEIGNQLHKYEAFYKSLDWLKEAQTKHSKEKKKEILTRRLIELFAYNNFLVGKKNVALEYIKQLLNIDPNNKKAETINLLYTKALENPHNSTIQHQAIKASKAKNFKKMSPEPGMFDSYVQIYSKLCRNEQFGNPNVIQYLNCYYSTNNNPFLILQPIKIEDAYLYPWIAIFHDIMSDDEIEEIKDLATPKLKRADVFKRDGSLTGADFRISKSAWLEDLFYPVVARISRRLEAVTGLNMNTAEDLQVVNYGIGGHYETHADFSLKYDNSFHDKTIGNRMATTLFYMSDVKAGGATVFPKLGITVFPKKGSAVFWYNLHKNGVGDISTIHGACPVLIGDKWVSNKWIHEIGQEFRRKCSRFRKDYEDKQMN